MLRLTLCYLSCTRVSHSTHQLGTILYKKVDRLSHTDFLGEVQINMLVTIHTEILILVLVRKRRAATLEDDLLQRSTALLQPTT